MLSNRKACRPALLAAWNLFSLGLPSADGAITNTWDGGASGGNWSLAANWNPAPGGVAPLPGNILRFPSGVSKLLTTNNFTAGVDFGGLLILDNYVLRGNSIDVSNFVSANGAISTSLSLDLGLLNDATVSASSQAILTGTKTLSLNGHLATFDVDGTINLKGPITGGGPNSALLKVGPGVLRLNGTNTLQGSIMVNEGQLFANGIVQSNVIVGADGFLGGTGRLGRASVAGTLHPGEGSPGTLSIVGSCSFGSSAVFALDLYGPLPGTGYGQLRCASLDLGLSILSVNRSPTYSPGAGTVFVIISNTSAAATSGTFAGLPNNAVFMSDGVRYQVSYTGGNGNDVVLKVLASPSVVRGPYLQTGTTNSMIVCWRSGTVSQGVVRFGTNLSVVNQMATEISAVSNHFVHVSNLAPNTKYFYSIGDASGPAAGGDSTYYFITSPAGPKAVRAWVIGDPGTTTPVQAAVRDAYESLAGTNVTDIWLMLGDNAYDSGTDAQYQSAIFDMYPELLRNTVVWSSIGNHETYNGLPTLPYFNIFDLPRMGEAGGVASGTEKYYSFDYANIHFVCLDAMTSDRSSNGPMCQWLRTDLANHTREWLIAFWHHPPYTKGTHDSDNFGVDHELIEMRQNAVPILEDYGVDLVLCGHSHVYERSYLLHGHYGYSGDFSAGMKVDPGSGRENETGSYRKSSSGLGAVYVVAGNAGQSGFGPLNHPAMFYSVSKPGSVVLDINGSRLDMRFLRDTGAVEDYFTILKVGGPGEIEALILNHFDGRKELRWNSEIGTKYQVQETLALAQPSSWSASSPVITAANGVSVWVTPFPETAPKKFYRVTKVP
ncbi:MAG TPA: metallophosphoesterase [Candidatus Saccharimonadales bacterium]|nr:metallophosphoesterase [Candidatus Saccharimonadales bacterium]